MGHRWPLALLTSKHCHLSRLLLGLSLSSPLLSLGLKILLLGSLLLGLHVCKLLGETCRQLQRVDSLALASLAFRLLPQPTQLKDRLLLGNLHGLERASDLVLLARGGMLMLVFLGVTENLPARQAHLGVHARDDRLRLGLLQPDKKIHVGGELR